MPTSAHATTSVNPGHDAPVGPGGDQLGRLPFARAIRRVIVEAPLGWSTRVGLYGPWGEGKTSVLELLTPLLEADDETVGRGLVVSLSVWDVSTEQEALERIHDVLDDRLRVMGPTFGWLLDTAWLEVTQRIGGPAPIGSSSAPVTSLISRSREWKDSKVRKLKRWFRSHRQTATDLAGEAGAAVVQAGATATAFAHGVAPQAIGALTAPVASAGRAMTKGAVATPFSKIGKVRNEHVKELVKLLAANYDIRRVIVYVDDLDRADPRAIPRTLLALRELLDWPDFVFVLAFDREVVGRGLEAYSKAFGTMAQGFLEKIIDVSFELPAPPQGAVSRFAFDEMARLCAFIPADTRLGVAGLFPENPRKIRAIIRDLHSLQSLGERIDRRELDWRGVVLQVIFQRWAPSELAKYVNDHWLGYRTPNPQLKAEGKTFEAHRAESIKEAIEKHGSGVGDSRCRSRLERLAVALCEQRGNTSPAQIESDMAMFFAPPAFTFPEFRRLQLQLHDSGARDALLEETIDEALKRCALSNEAVAGELLGHALGAHGRAKAWLDEVGVASQKPDAQSEFEKALELLAYFWCEAAHGGLAEARSKVANGTRLLDHLSDWDKLEERQVRLIKQVIALSEDPVGLWESTFHLHSFMQTGFDEPVLKLMEPVLVSWAVAALTRPDGISTELAVEDRRRTCVSWFFGSALSPLFASRNLGRVIDTLTAQRNAPDPGVRLQGSHNAGQLLGRLSPLESDGWNAGRLGFLDSIEPLLSEAWQTYTAVELVGRRRDTAIRRRRQLIETGVRQSVLAPPAWMVPDLPTQEDDLNEPAVV